MRNHVTGLLEPARLIAGLRRHDLRAAATFAHSMYPGCSPLVRWARFAGWAWRQTVCIIPSAMNSVTFGRPISRQSTWLAGGNPWANRPWRDRPDARLPDEVEVAVVGAGFTGASCAYHWAKMGTGRMVVLDMGDPASGASGCCEGLVVMGRYFGLVRDTVQRSLARVRPDLSPDGQARLAAQFAAAYVRGAYHNAELIAQTIAAEGYDCEYARHGWIQVREQEDQPALEESVRSGRGAGFDDWTRIEPRQAMEAAGMRLDWPAGFSQGAGHFHPAKWVWCLLATALRQPEINLFTRTRVLQIEDAGDGYRVHTHRGTVWARAVINATESYTGILHPELAGVLYPVQTQAAYAKGGPEAMRPQVGYSSKRAFYGRLAGGVIFGSDSTRLPAHQAGRNRPARFITKFVIGELYRYFGRASLHVTHEWSATAGFTIDEFPVVGALDHKRQYIIGGMCGSGTGVSFNAARCIVRRILGDDGPDDYPAEYFAPSRLLDPQHHPWPAVNPAGPDPRR